MSFFAGVLSAAEVLEGGNTQAGLVAKQKSRPSGEFPRELFCVERFGSRFLHLLQAIKELHGYQGFNSGLALLSTKNRGRSNRIGTRGGEFGSLGRGLFPTKNELNSTAGLQVYKVIRIALSYF